MCWFVLLYVLTCLSTGVSSSSRTYVKENNLSPDFDDLLAEETSVALSSVSSVIDGKQELVEPLDLGGISNRVKRTFPLPLPSVLNLASSAKYFFSGIAGTIVFNVVLWIMSGILHATIGGPFLGYVMPFLFVAAIPLFDAIGLGPSFIFFP